MVTGMTFLTLAAIKIDRKLLLLEFFCLNEWIIAVKCLVEFEMKKIQNKLCYFFAFFPPKSLHFCRMTRIH